MGLSLIFYKLLLLNSAWAGNYPDPDPKLFQGPIPILQGPSSDSVTQFSILRPKNLTLHYAFVTENQNSVQTIQATLHGVSFSNWVYDHIRLGGLQPGVKYTLQISNSKKEIIDTRDFSTLAIHNSKAKIFIASCMDDALVQEQKRIWAEVAEQKPDLLFFLGDTVYADRFVGPYKGPVDAETVWKRYVETRLTVDVYRWKRLVPTFATWDDHDFGGDDTDDTYFDAVQTRKNFDAFFSQEAISNIYEKGPGVSSRFLAFGLQFFLMDDRSFRSPPEHKESNGKIDSPIRPAVFADSKAPKKYSTHWGIQQERWLLKNLEKKGPVTWILNGSQFFGGYLPNKESYEIDHPKNFEAFIKTLHKIPTQVFFVSGDAHASEIMEISKPTLPYTSYEITTSGIHAKIFERFKEHPNPRQIVGNDRDFNYMIVDADTSPVEARPTFKVSAWGPGHRTLFTRDLKIQP